MEREPGSDQTYGIPMDQIKMLAIAKPTREWFLALPDDTEVMMIGYDVNPFRGIELQGQSVIVNQAQRDHLINDHPEIGPERVLAALAIYVLPQSEWPDTIPDEFEKGN